MLTEVSLFFKKEPRYFWILLAVGIIYGAIFLSPHFKRPATGKPVLFEKFRSDLSPPPTQAWSFSMLFKVVILFMLAGIVVSFLLGLISAILPEGGSENSLMLLHMLILNGLCLYWMIHFVRRSGGRWQDLGLRVPDTGLLREVAVGFVGYLRILPLFALVIATLLTLANFLNYEPPAHPLVNIFIEEEKRAPFLMILSVLLGAVISPIFEEIFFRGFCYPILRNHWGKIWGMILSSAFFAGIHHSGFVFWPIFILGMALAFLYEKRRSLIASITLHITHNSLLIGYFFLAKQIIGR